MGESLLARAVRSAGGIEALVDRLGPQRVVELTKTWAAIARPEQIIPGERDAASARTDWRNWMLMAGRGFGKTRTGAEAVNALVEQGRARAIALIAPTYEAGRRLMIENPTSGLIAVAHPSNRPRWEKSDKELHWPNGAIAYLFTSDVPDGVRGFNGDLAWCEEIGAWKYPGETWSNLQLGLRIVGPKGDRARAIITTTPRPTELIRQLVANPRTAVTGGTTYDNAANLDPDTLKEFVALYEGTRLGKQELLAELLGDTPGALWTLALIERFRVLAAPDFVRFVVAIDPATKDTSRVAADADALELDSGAEQGIIGAGIAPCRCKGPGEPEMHAFVTDDVSGVMSPREWAETAAILYTDRRADRVVAEINQGGALVESTLRTLGRPDLSYHGVHASRGKQTRAEPVAALYEQGKVHHVGTHGKLEDQMTTWQPLRSRKSPDRMDALVWALTELMLPESEDIRFRPKVAGKRRI